jgi:thiol-disulfide isomerase/thioredoxin
MPIKEEKKQMNKLYMFVFCCMVQLATADEPVPESIDFSLPGLDGKSYSLSQFRDSWVVVNYWATWCAPCRKEIPELSELHTERKDVVVLGIAYEDMEPGDFNVFLEEYAPSYPILLPDVYDMPEALAIPRVLPTTFIVNPAGEKVRTFMGPITRDELEKAIVSAAGEATTEG